MEDRKMMSMLFNYQTTGKTDYRDGKITVPVRTVYKKKPLCPRPSPMPFKDVQSLTTFKDPNLAFSLMHKPKDIVRRNPYDVQKPFHKPPDEGREQAQMTRPRRVMTPAVSMDDIADSEIREILIKEVYSSSAHRAMEEAVMLVRTKHIKAPFPGLPAPANPIYLPRLREPVVPPEWRRETVEWDTRQLRGHVDPDREFWIPYDLYKSCRACKESAQVARTRRLSTGKH